MVDFEGFLATNRNLPAWNCDCELLRWCTGFCCCSALLLVHGLFKVGVVATDHSWISTLFLGAPHVEVAILGIKSGPAHLNAVRIVTSRCSVVKWRGVLSSRPFSCLFVSLSPLVAK